MRLYIRHEPTAPVVPIVASLPHSGLYVPPEIARRLMPEHRTWLRNTDWYLGELYSFLPSLGAMVLEATHSRYVVDLNRDPAGELYGDFVRAVVAARTAHGDPVYALPPEPAECHNRLRRYHAPVHDALRSSLDELVERFGTVLLLDLHSFMGPLTSDVCLGDRWGATCAPEVIASFDRALAQQGLEVVRNTPFAGGYIVRKHADPPRVEALQIELRYTTYLDCTQIDEPGQPRLDSDRIASAQSRLRPAFEEAIAQWLSKR